MERIYTRTFSALFTRAIMLLTGLLLFIGTARAQYVTIPDTNFMYFLQALVPNCMNGNQLNTACSDIQNITTMDCSGLNIADLTGVENFTSLDSLNCGSNMLTTIFSLPNVSYLDMSDNFISTMPYLPFNLQTLICPWNGLQQLPEYMTVSYLDCSYNVLQTLPPIQNLNVLNCSGNYLTSIDNIQAPYLYSLNCSYNDLQIIDSLSFMTSLYELDCSYNQLDSLPALPSSLYTLTCNNNDLTTLPSLPDGINAVYGSNNLMTSLPVLPQSLSYLDCSFNQLTTLPAINSSLGTLECNNNRLTSLPALLSSSLGTVNCYYNQLTTIPALPASLTYLNCRNNPITTLPALASLGTLICDSTSITALPALPASLTYLSCTASPVVTIPVMSKVQQLYCGSPQLTGFTGALPVSLIAFACQNTLLTSVPALPSTLDELYLSNNPLLASVPTLPSTLDELMLNYDYALSSIPPVSSSYINQFSIVNDTNIHCLPLLGTISSVDLTGSGVQCLPNYGHFYTCTPAENTFPLCDGTNGCATYWNLAGRTYYDANSDCKFDGSDIAQQNVKLQLFQGGVLQQQAYTVAGGLYSMQSPALGIYELATDTSGLPFTILCPASGAFADTLTGTDSLQNGDDFAFICKSGFDVGVQSISIPWGLPVVRESGVFTVAGDMSNFYGAHCASGTSGTVTLSLTGPAAIVSTMEGALSPTLSDTNSISWTIADFGTVDVLNDFNILIRPHPSAQVGDEVCITVTVTPLAGDNNPGNNTLTQCFPVLSSFDPNGKEASPANNVDTGGWITYTIHFQNTGNDTAFNITVLDTLDSHFNLSTFQLLAYSGKIKTQVSQSGIVQFTFSNINLPDSTATPTGSIGYVQYKIKLQTGLAEGASVTNTASIYFDLNPPVATNTTVNTIGTATGIPTVLKGDAQVMIYPNPSTGSWQLSVGNSLVGSALDIFDEQGRLVFHSKLSIQNSKLELEVPSGVYYLRISNANTSVVRKLVKLN